MTTLEIMTKVKHASKEIVTADTEKKNLALTKMAEAVVTATADILEANRRDMDAAKGTVSDVMLDRLMLSEERISGMAKGILDVVRLPDPVGKLISSHTRENGLEITKVTVPMGVIAIIYESRPNVTSDAAALAVKSGSACLLRSGKEAHRSAAAIVDALQKGLAEAGLPREAVMLVEDTSRESAGEMMKAVGYIDLLIPRGGKGLIKSCIENATVPCIETGTGICHVYVDRDADLEKAVKIIYNAKTSRPSVCNAAEVCVVHRDVLEKFIPMLEDSLVFDRKKAGLTPVELRMDKEAISFSKEGRAAADSDFDTEFLDYVLAVKTVSSVTEAASHISAHSTGHSDAIVSENKEAQKIFTLNVDSSAVYVNASTRFTDGGEFGLGCEMGISTQKLHARGPMGLDELCTYKYVITGDGTVR